MPPTPVAQARELLVAGDTAGARRACGETLASTVNAGEKARAHMILAACARSEGDTKAMLAHAVQAASIAPDDATAHYALAECADDAGDKALAISELRRAIECDPALVQAHRHLGSLLVSRGDSEGAIAILRRAIALDPDHPEAWNNLGAALHFVNRLPEAESAYRRALSLKPDYLRAQCNLAVVQRDQGHPDLAEATLRACIARSPQGQKFRPALSALADLLRARGSLDEAAELYLRSAKLAPGESAADMLDLGMVFCERGDPKQARKAHGVALRENPRYLRAALGMNLTLPMIYADAADVARERVAFAHGLDALDRDIDALTSESTWSEVADGLIWSNFLLAYQGENDRLLQARYAALAAHALDRADPGWRAPLPMKPVTGRRVRIGFVSALLRECTVGRYFTRWITDLDRDRFEVCVYPLAAATDAVTMAIAARADRTRPFVGGDALPSTIAPAIRAEKLDILVYPELGMDQVTFALASMRLAPRQFAGWGHPVTTGHPTIDAFLSCAAMEPVGGDAHYTERLVRLPGIGTRFRRQALPAPVERETLALPRDATLLLCPQSLFKIHPDNDSLFARVLAANPRAMLVLFAGRHPAITDQFMRRLERCFGEHGISIRERTRVLPQLSHDGYLVVNLACDAMLDTLRWSGGQTSVDALDCGLPIVTLPGEMMRGRQSAGMLSLLGLQSLIASDIDDYVRIANRLCGDGAWRAELASLIRERCSVLFDDPAPIAALDAFYRDAVASRSS